MAGYRRAAGFGFCLLWTCAVFGNGLHIEILGGRNDQLFYQNSLIRQRREWIVPPAKIWEERDNSHRNPIARIRSDREVDPGVIVTYTISGQGVTEPPYHLFVINGKTGELNITGIVDREKTPELRLKGYALNEFGEKLERPLDLRIKVLDINDNEPVFSQAVFMGSVEELCNIDTLVMKINATDADDPNSPNSKIAFKILSQEPSNPPAFMIERATGEVRTATFQLDREVQSSYSLIVEARDLDGAENGNHQETTLQIKILDVNDNIPVLEKTMYEGSVKENLANVEIMRLKVFDLDEQFTDNWLAKFMIVSGNEGGYFHIETDSQTNEGILTLVKEINYEELQTMDLQIVVSNKASYHRSIITQGYQAKPIPIKIKVENVREGPVFKPQILTIKTSETMKINQIIGSFQAFDEDTGKIAGHITYAKGIDVANWISINSKTAEITLLKVPDYESIHVINGTYTATILGITTDYPPKTATGTIVIQVEDVNDHCPTLVTPRTVICTDAKYINITAEDQDAYPNGGPFTFQIIDEAERMSDKWRIGQTDGPRAQLLPQDIKPGRYRVPILVADNQGFSCPEQQILEVDVCDCEDSGACSKTLVSSSVFLGPAAVALIILALLLLLLIPLLLLACGFGSGGGKGFVAIPDNSEEMLRNWNSEGAAPEGKAVLNLISSSALDHSGSNMGSGAVMVGSGAAAGGGSSSMIKEQYVNCKTTTEQRREEQEALLCSADCRGGSSGMAAGRGWAVGGTGMAGAGRTIALENGSTLNEEFLRGYFCEKADAFADEDEVQFAKDCLLIYSQEEEHDSPHGSVGCCSFIDGDFDECFLDDLGDKFKTLAEICMGKHLSLEAEHSNAQTEKQIMLNPVANECSHQYSQRQNTLNSEHTYTSGSIHQLPEPGKGLSSETMTEETVTETIIATKPNLQPVKRIPDPLISGNVVVTETSYGAVPPTVILDPQFKENIVVTERVLAPASSLQDMIEMPAGVFADLPDSKYVVVRERERVLVPSSDVNSSMSIPNVLGGQNVVLAESVVATAGPATFSESERQQQIIISDPLLNQSSTQESASISSTLSKSSRVKKYSSVQYACS